MEGPSEGPGKVSQGIMIALTVVIAVSAAVQTGVFMLQRIEAGQQTERIIAAGNGLVGANERSAQAMEDSAAQATSAMNRSLAQSKKSLEKTIEITREITRNDQRAWVAPVGIDRTSELKAGTAFGVQITWVNSGKTPALNFRAVVSVRHQQSGTAFTPVYDQLPKRPSNSVLAPNATQRTLLPASLPSDLTQAILSGSQMLYAFGRSTYDDIFGRHHMTTFASVYDPANGTWSVLDTYNTAD